LPVVDAGVLSEGDLLHCEEDGTATRKAWRIEALTPASALALSYAKSHGRGVAEVMSDRVISAPEDTPLIANLLAKHRIKRVPILKDGKLVGIVSRSNLIPALASVGAAGAPQAKDLTADRIIRDAILSKLAEQPWTDFVRRAKLSSSPMGWFMFGASSARRRSIKRCSRWRRAFRESARSLMR
jgi:hypothetical protein